MNLPHYFPPNESRQFTASKSNRNRAVSALLRYGCIAAILVSPLSARAQDIFLRIGGQAAAMGQNQTAPTLAGESTDVQYTGWIPVFSMSHGVSRAISIENPAGRANHQDVHWTKSLDKTSPALNLLVNGVSTTTVSQPIDFVTIDFRKTGTTEVYYRIELQEVYLTTTAVSASAGGGTPSESVSVVYNKIRWSYVKYVSGKAQAPVTTGWDVAANKVL